MKLHPSLLLSAMLSLTGAHSLRAGTASSPANDLAQKLQADPKERGEAGKRLEAFLLKPDSAGKSFVSADVDRAALGAVAREWARKADASRLAVLLFVSAPDSKAESRLRAALSSWTGDAQIKKEAGSRATVAFLADAGDKATHILADPKTGGEIDAAIEANDQTAVPGLGARESIQRAQELRERLASGNSKPFGPDREAPGPNDPSAQTTSSPVGALAKKLSDDPKEREEAGRRLETFLLKPDSSGKSFVSADVDRTALGAVARDWAGKADAGQLALLLSASTPGSKAESRLRAALSSWTGNNQIDKTRERAHLTALLNDATTKAGQVLDDQRTRRDIDAAIQANDLPAASLPSSLRKRKMFEVPSPKIK